MIRQEALYHPIHLKVSKESVPFMQWPFKDQSSQYVTTVERPLNLRDIPLENNFDEFEVFEFNYPVFLINRGGRITRAPESALPRKEPVTSQAPTLKPKVEESIIDQLSVTPTKMSI